MGSLLAQIMPVAIVIALEPICVIAALVMTATARPLANSAAYLAALAAVMLGYGVAVLLVFRHHALAGGTRTDDIVQVLWLLIGVGFLAAFVVVLVRHPRPKAEGEVPRWTRLVERLGPLGAAGIGVFLVNWEMETPALTEIVKARVPLATELVALTLFVAVALSTVVVPVAVYLAWPEKVGGFLDGSKAWLVRYQRPIVLVLFCVIGVLYTYKGAAALLAQ